MLLQSISMQRTGPGLAKARQLLEQSMAAGGKQAQEEEATNIIYSSQMFPYIVKSYWECQDTYFFKCLSKIHYTQTLFEFWKALSF